MINIIKNEKSVTEGGLFKRIVIKIIDAALMGLVATDKGDFYK